MDVQGIRRELRSFGSISSDIKGLKEHFVKPLRARSKDHKSHKFYSGLGRTTHTVMRHSNIYGPYDNFDLKTSHVCAAKINEVTGTSEGDKVIIWGDGKEKRDLLYVDDFVDFVELAVQNKLDGVYNVGSGDAISISDLTQKVIDVSGKDLQLAYDPSKPTIKMNLSLDCSKANGVGWTQKTSLEEGIKKTLDWYNANIL